MYKRILVAFDRDGLADSALPAVATLATQSNAEVLIVSVRDAYSAVETVEAASEVVDRAAARLRSAGITAQGEVRSMYRGSVAKQIVERAKEYGADLVALGSHGHGDAAGLLLSSVSHRVAAGLDCPVLLVRGGRASREAAEARLRTSPIRKVLVAVTDSDESRAGVEAAREVAGEHGAAVRLVHVLERVVVTGAAAYFEPEESAHALLNDAEQRVSGSGRLVESRLLTGNKPVAEQLASAADEFDADLIVLGSRRLTDLGGLLLGSVAHGLVRRTNRAVLLAERVHATSEPRH